MKNLKMITVFLLLAFLVGIHTTQAQRRKVIKTPRRTVVVKKTPRGRVVYKKKAPRVRVRRALSPKAVVVVHKRTRYYYDAGYFYRPHTGGYVIVRPHYGWRVRVLPVGYRRIVVRNRPYFYFGGVFYLPTKEKGQEVYDVAEAPEGAIVDNLPEDKEEVTIDDQTYYEYNDVLYAQSDEGYEVVGNISLDEE